MYNGAGSSGSPAPSTRERLPNFLLSPLGGASPPSGVPSAASPAPMGASPAFNARLRPANAAPPSGQQMTLSGGAGLQKSENASRESPASPFDRRVAGAGFGLHHGASHTPSSARKPPTRSLLDSGPGVMSMQSPSPEQTRSLTSSARMASPATPIQRMGLFSPGVPVDKGTAGGAEKWVTVFGFPAAVENTVLREFRRNGEVIRTLPGRGNWLHIMYRTNSQAQVALHRPWRLVAGGTIMVGITACTEPEACVSAAEHMDPELSSSMLIASPSNESSSAQGSRAMAMMPTPASAGLRTPKSVVRMKSQLTSADCETPQQNEYQNASRAVQNSIVSPGPSSILRPPPQPRGILGFLSDYMSGA